ncbi:MAG: hypothetical protein V3T01_06420, partial [Myxococcota bacterium]
AWKLGTGLQTRRVPDPDGLDDASVWGTHAGIGLAWDPTPGVLLYGLGDLRLDVGPDLKGSVSFGPGAKIGVFAGTAGMRWRGHLFGEVTRFGLGDTTTRIRAGLEARLTLSRHTALILEADFNRIYGESWPAASIQLNRHF